MIKEKIEKFEDLRVWQGARKLTFEIYKTTKQFPKEEIFGLTNQLRRASVSIGSNIAEGFSRLGPKDKARFYYMAQGSLDEIKNQLYVSRDIKYLNNDDFKNLMNLADETHKMLRGLIKSVNLLPRY